MVPIDHGFDIFLLNMTSFLKKKCKTLVLACPCPTRQMQINTILTKKYRKTILRLPLLAQLFGAVFVFKLYALPVFPYDPFDIMSWASGFEHKWWNKHKRTVDFVYCSIGFNRAWTTYKHDSKETKNKKKGSISNDISTNIYKVTITKQKKL